MLTLMSYNFHLVIELSLVVICKLNFSFFRYKLFRKPSQFKRSQIHRRHVGKNVQMYAGHFRINDTDGPVDVATGIDENQLCDRNGR